MHKCKGGSIISSVFICDGNFDCGESDTSDEDNCTCKVLDEAKEKKCKLICRRGFGCKRSFLLTSGHNVNDQSKGNESGLEPLLNILKCTNGDIVDMILVDDLVPDCKGAEDERKLQNLLVSGKIYECPQPHQIPCRKGHSRCFNINDICVYRLNKYKHIVPCRTGEHMEECKTFECNKKFKFPGYYCIPFAYICDGKWDCPNGVDESVTNCGK